MNDSASFNIPNSGSQWHTPGSPSAAPLSVPPSMNEVASTPRRRRRWMWWIIIPLILLGLGGGGYFAYSKELIVFPYIPTPTESMVSRLFRPNQDIASATSTLNIHIRSEKNPSTTKANSNTNSSGLGLGTADALDDILSTLDLKLSAEGYTFQGDSLETSQFDLKFDAIITIKDKPTKFTFLMRFVDGSLYLSLSTLTPENEMFKDVVGKWLVIKSSDIEQYAQNANANRSSTATDNRIFQESLRLFIRQAIRNKAIIIERVADETVSGELAEKYVITTNHEKLLRTFDQMVESKGLTTKVRDYWKMLKNIGSSASVKKSIAALQISLWVDSDQRFTRRLLVAQNISAGDEGSINMEYDMTIKAIGEKKTVVKPEDAIPYDEALSSLVGSMGNEISPEIPPMDLNTNTNSPLNDNTNTSLNINVNGDDAPDVPPAAVDSDGDGLTDTNESLLGTSPTNADTDNDGYPDGDEIKNGYNPNGPGRL